METVKVCLLNESQPSMTTYPDGKAVSMVHSTQVTRFDIKDFDDFVFMLGQLWNLDVDQIKSHWTSNLFAGGMTDHGKSVSIICSVSLLATFLHCREFIHIFIYVLPQACTQMLPMDDTKPHCATPPSRLAS